MKKILFLMSCSILAIHSNQTFASHEAEDQDYQAALRLSMEVNGIGDNDFEQLLTSTDALFVNQKGTETEDYSREDLELIVAIAESENEAKIRQIAFPDSGEKEEKEVKQATNEQPDDGLVFKAAEIVKEMVAEYENKLKEIGSQKKSIYFDEGEIRSIPDIIRDLEHDGENSVENRNLLNLLREELQEIGKTHSVHKLEKSDICEKIATGLAISLELATKVYELSFE
jgi:hypothetical protein